MQILKVVRVGDLPGLPDSLKISKIQHFSRLFKTFIKPVVSSRCDITEIYRILYISPQISVIPLYSTKYTEITGMNRY